MQKADHQCDRRQVKDLQQIINIGPSIAADLRQIGIQSPQQLIGSDPVELYCAICREGGEFHDPCVLDTMMACVDYMNGSPPKSWWSFTKRRKKQHADVVAAMREAFPVSN